MLSLDDDHHVLVVIEAEIDERGLEVQPIAGHGVEVPAVVGEDAFQKALGGRHFSFAGPLEFDVQGNRQATLSDQVADHAAMIVFGDFLLIHLQGTLQALIAAAFAAGEKNSWPSTAANRRPSVSSSILLRLMRKWTSLSISP